MSWFPLLVSFLLFFSFHETITAPCNNGCSAGQTYWKIMDWGCRDALGAVHCCYLKPQQYMTCETCEAGYIATDDGTGVCTKIPCSDPNCDDCSSNPTVCITCNNGFYMDQTSTCQQCLSQCATCSSARRCTSCKSRRI